MSGPIEQAVRQSQNKYYGKYRGFVVDNQDPEERGRLQVRIPSVFGQEQSFWALPCLPFGGLADQGFFMIPEVSAQVWVEFEEGNSDSPIWVGVFWQPSKDAPTEAKKVEPTTRIIKTPSGHILQFDDESGAEKIRLHSSHDAEFVMDENGSIEVKDGKGATLNLDANGNEVTLKDSSGNSLTMNSSGVEVKDSSGNEITMQAGQLNIKGVNITVDGQLVQIGGTKGEPLIKGASFLAMFATHMHTCTAPGSPSSPPIPQGEMSTLTSKTVAS